MLVVLGWCCAWVSGGGALVRWLDRGISKWRNREQLASCQLANPKATIYTDKLSPMHSVQRTPLQSDRSSLRHNEPLKVDDDATFKFSLSPTPQRHNSRSKLVQHHQCNSSKLRKQTANTGKLAVKSIEQEVSSEQQWLQNVRHPVRQHREILGQLN